MASNKKFVKLLASTTAVSLTGGAAMADPADWAGFYAGGMYSANGGEFSYADDDYDIDLSNAGGFVGFNAAFGSVVVGLEYGLSFGAASSDYASLSDVQDLRVRVGTTFGDAFVYGAVGASSGFVSAVGPVTPDYDVSGVSYGVGVDYAVTDQLFVGLDYTVRDMAGGEDGPGGSYVDVRSMSSISIRVGYKF